MTEFTVSSNPCNARSYGSDLIWTALTYGNPSFAPNECHNFVGAHGNIAVTSQMSNEPLSSSSYRHDENCVSIEFDKYLSIGK